MNEMVERVARAICLDDQVDPDQLWNAEHPQPRWMLYADNARAAIAAMRVPTEAMIERGMQNITIVEEDADARHSLGNAWPAMIDAALAE